MEFTLKTLVKQAVKEVFDVDLNENVIQIQVTRKDFEGDYTVNVFPFLKQVGGKPEEVADKLGTHLANNHPDIAKHNVIKGFLNISLAQSFWLKQLYAVASTTTADKEKTMIEFSSPNTNKPLHLGHIRNNLLGESISRILDKAGFQVTKVNLVNDRGIHICKSMLAWEKWGKNANPETTGIKGDKLVGDFYVKFDQEYKKQQKELIDKGASEEEAAKSAPLILEAQEMLRKWESGDEKVLTTWSMMNSWVYDGFDITYNRLGISFDKIYYESDTYKLGKKIVLKGLEDKILIQKEDQSVWADLTNDKLDEKILLRSDGTSVYMTQDIGTAELRHSDYQPKKMIYVVGNEQIYHFKVLKIVLKKLGYEWADSIYHFSYGMVELPEGKMKSREGTVVDADDLLDQMIDTAREMSKELGKLDGFTVDEKEDVYRIIGLGALKYFILKVDPKKNMVFNPKESIDFNGNTGPFIQYTYARINSLLTKAQYTEFSNPEINLELTEKEIELIKLQAQYQGIINDAANKLSPAVIANYAYDLAKEYNQFYHDHTVIKAEEPVKSLRLALSYKTAQLIKESMNLLGIEVPGRM